ncbi:hypothetical protein AAC387_Pa02g1905 [Persea americana]
MAQVREGARSSGHERARAHLEVLQAESLLARAAKCPFERTNILSRGLADKEVVRSSGHKRAGAGSHFIAQCCN